MFTKFTKQTSKRWLLLLWALIAAYITTIFIIIFSEEQMFNGDEIMLSAKSGWYIEISDESSNIKVRGASSGYFRLVDESGAQHLYGVPERPPLGYKGNNYFYLESKIEPGKWEIVDGSKISFQFTGSSLSLKHFPANNQKILIAIGGIALGVLFFVAGLKIIYE